MELRSLKKEEWMPNMAWTQNYFSWSDNEIKEFWKATRCNIFAGDFSKEYLNLATTPWGNTDWNADKIHKNLANINVFIPLDWNEVWTYTNGGYPVFITTPTSGAAGHIAIAYPVDDGQAASIEKIAEGYNQGKVVQAGATNGIMLVKEAWRSETFFKNNATAYMYLGHLIQ